MKSYRAYCKDEDGLFFWVMVYPTKKSMQAKLRQESLSTKCDAMCSDWVHQKWDGKRFKTQRDIGCLYFHHDSMRVGVICHEAVHAALSWHRATDGGMKLRLSRIRANPDPRSGGHVNQQEEDVAWVAGNIARQVVLGYRNKKARK